jgi:toxin CcdB
LLPYLIDIQNDLLGNLETRVVVPLYVRSAAKSIQRLTPLVTFKGSEYLLMTPQGAGVPVARFGHPAGDMSDQRDLIIAAIDFLVRGF